MRDMHDGDCGRCGTGMNTDGEGGADGDLGGVESAPEVQCTQVRERYTQQILISEWMPVVHAVLDEDQPYPA